MIDFKLNKKNTAKLLLVPLFSLVLSSPVLAGACGSGNKDEFYDELNASGQGGNIVFGYQNCGGYIVDKVKFYIRVDGDNMWTTTKTSDLRSNEYHIVALDPGVAGAKVRAALGQNDDEVQLRVKIWIRAGESKSKTKTIPYDEFVVWGTNSSGTTTTNNSISTKRYSESGHHTYFMQW